MDALLGGIQQTSAEYSYSVLEQAGASVDADEAGGPACQPARWSCESSRASVALSAVSLGGRALRDALTMCRCASLCYEDLPNYHEKINIRTFGTESLVSRFKIFLWKMLQCSCGNFINSRTHETTFHCHSAFVTFSRYQRVWEVPRRLT